MAQSCNQVNVTPEEFAHLMHSICDNLDCSKEGLRDVIRSKARESVKTKQGYLSTTPLSIVKKVISSGNIYISDEDKDDLLKNLINTHDVRDNVYEGGFKTWEGSKDLVTFLDSSQVLKTILEKTETINILELGAGSALPAIFCLIELTKRHPNFNQTSFNVHVQDYNREVLEYLFLPNLGINLGLNTAQDLIRSDRIRALYGPWSSFHSCHKYDLIIMSETIYNVDSYSSLHSLLAEYLRPDGVVVMAAKDTYFGCTGSLFEWIDFVEKHDILSLVSITQIESKGIPRSIVIMKHRQKDLT